MGVLYLAALIIGLGTIVVQLFMGGDGDTEVEAATDADHGLEPGLDQGAGPNHELAHGSSVDAGFLPIFLSLRFWVFGLLAFGMVGSLLHFLGLASALLTASAALVVGLGSGMLAAWTFRALSTQQVTSGAHEDDAVGHVGKLLIGMPQHGRGKVRIQLKGQTLDLLATTDEVELRAGEQVLIEEMRDGQAHVSKAPADFLPR